MKRIQDLDKKIYSKIDYILKLPFNLSLIIFTILYSVILVSVYSSNGGFDMIATHQSNMLYISSVGIITGALLRNEVSSNLIKVSVISIFLSAVAITLVKSLIAPVILTNIFFVLNIYTTLLVLKNIWFISSK
jgi:hypothetical protein